MTYRKWSWKKEDIVLLNIIDIENTNFGKSCVLKDRKGKMNITYMSDNSKNKRLKTKSIYTILKRFATNCSKKTGSQKREDVGRNWVAIKVMEIDEFKIKGNRGTFIRVMPKRGVKLGHISRSNPS